MEGANQKQVVSAAAFNAKFRSKNEVFRFLSYDCNAYLPSYNLVGASQFNFKPV